MTTPPARWSLKRRLAIRLLIVLTMGVLGPSVVMVGAAMWAIDSMDDRALQDQAGDIVRNLDVTVSPPALHLPARLANAYATSGDSYLYAVLDAAGTILAASSPAAETLARVADDMTPGVFFLVTRPNGGQPWYAYMTTAGPYFVAVAQGSLHDDSLADSVMRDLVGFSFITALPLLAVTLLVTFWTLNRAFRQMERVAGEVRAITPGGAEARLSSEGLPSEIAPLVAAVNDALFRLGRAYEVEKRFTTDAAHELRTPVAVLTARIDTLPPGPTRDSLAADAARLSRLVSQMLDVARLDAAPLPMNAHVDLVAIVREAVAALAPLALRDRRTMEMRAPDTPVMVEGHEGALRLAVTNLVENAMLHTPRGTPIDIEVTPQPAIRVLDRGPGVAETERASIFERFQRSPSATSSGTGLGLAIVAEIAARHGAQAAVSGRPGGGGIFEIRWPDAT
ncbi:sensor histidine kinase [Ancylobacter amanitiformis]|uniref:histidine kinase n=1 Tax=Ancylobacter amanitiformis TaxID=217069 RepID=A0ABU0LKT2_9HYPH|nr:ATP-binding protein [Ancylobacter amanitiformis]MDQ0509264.1 signal transduction histidine kinase [Ancylobacter amanitiformis]